MGWHEFLAFEVDHKLGRAIEHLREISLRNALKEHRGIGQEEIDDLIDRMGAFVEKMRVRGGFD